MPLLPSWLCNCASVICQYYYHGSYLKDMPPIVGLQNTILPPWRICKTTGLATLPCLVNQKGYFSLSKDFFLNNKIAGACGSNRCRTCIGR